MKTNTSLRLCLLLLTFCATMLHAVEIKYGPNIVYDGNVNEAGQPFKKGKLITTYKTSSNGKVAEEKDILEGEFNGRRVEKAKLSLAGKRIVFEGVVEYTIKEGDNSVTYRLLEGELRDNSSHKLSIPTRRRMTIIRQPGKDMGCTTTTRPLMLKRETLEMSESNLAQWGAPYAPLTLETLGLTGAERVITCTLDKNFNLQEEEKLQLKFGEDKTVLADISCVSVLTDNDDHFMLYRVSNKTYFRRQYTDANIETNPQGCTIKYTNGNTFKGTINIAGNQEPNALYKRIMQSNTLAEAGISILTGEMTQADGQVVKYVEGLTEAEAEAARARREREAAEERARQERQQAEERARREREAAEERARQEQEAAQRAAEAKRARAKLVGTWELLDYYDGIKIIYTLKADGTMTADYTYTHPQLLFYQPQGYTLKFKTSSSWSTNDNGFCVNQNGAKDLNIYINFANRATMTQFNAGCRKYGKEYFTSVTQFEMLKKCDGGKDVAYDEKCFRNFTISGTSMTATTYRHGEEVTVKFRKIK